MKTKILYVERKFWEFVSIEKVFRQIADNLTKDNFEFSFKQMLYGNGFADVIKNLLFFRCNEADIYHITGHIHYIALRLPRKHTVLTIHDLGFLHTRKGLRRYVLKKLLLDLPVRKLKYITAISAATKKEIVKFTNCDEKKIRLIENPVREFISFEKKTFDKYCPLILQIGTSLNKNLSNLVKALNGITCILNIIGKLDENLIKELKENGINYENKFDLSDEEMEQQYQKSDIVAFCSTYEGFGLPIIEAQAMQKPIMTSNLSPMREVSGDAACLVNPFDVSSIREGVMKIIENSQYREELIEKGIENIRRFRVANIVKLYENLYQEMLSAK